MYIHAASFFDYIVHIFYILTYFIDLNHFKHLCIKVFFMIALKVFDMWYTEMSNSFTVMENDAL